MLCFLLLATACDGEPPVQYGVVGTEAPEYGAPDVRGDSVRLAELRGQVVLLNVWATWCIPCRREIPELQALHQRYQARGLRVIGVSVDGNAADQDVVAYMKDFGMTYTVLRDPGESISTVFAIQGVPASFLIDQQGIVRWRHLGPFKADDPQLQNALRSTL